MPDDYSRGRRALTPSSGPNPLNVRLKPSAPYRALLIDAQLERAQLFASVMADRGYSVTQTVTDVDEAFALRSDAGSTRLADWLDLLVLYASALGAREFDGIRRLTEAVDLPLLVITESGAPEAVCDAIAAGASFCQPLGVNADRLQSGLIGAIEVHKQLQRLRTERDQAVRALDERKLIDRAKSIVMATRSLNEQAAFAHLQKLSMGRNTPMAEIARSIIEAKELLG